MRLKKYKDAEKIVILFNKLHYNIPNCHAMIIDYEVYVFQVSEKRLHFTPLKKWTHDGYWNSFLKSVKEEGKRYKLLKKYL